MKSYNNAPSNITEAPHQTASDLEPFPLLNVVRPGEKKTFGRIRNVSRVMNQRMQFYNATVSYLQQAPLHPELWRDLDLLHAHPFTPDPEYRNPCWMTSSFVDNNCDFTHYTIGAPALQPDKLVFGPKLRCMPFFYLIGQAKAGTTDIFHRISAHPEIRQGRDKECHWIGRIRFKPGCSKVDHFMNFFQDSAAWIKRKHVPGKKSQYIIGDGTPLLFSDHEWWDLLPGNQDSLEPRVTKADIIWRLNPHAKILLSLRNPTDRVYSLYKYTSTKRRLPSSEEEFHNMMTEEIKKYKYCFRMSTVRSCAYNYTLSKLLESSVTDLVRGLYPVFVKDWLAVFPRHQIHIIRFEDYVKNTTQHLIDIFKFLKIRKLPEKNIINIARLGAKNRIKKKPMWAGTRTLLDDFYSPFNAQLAEMLQDDKFLWKN